MSKDKPESCAQWQF